MGTAIISDLPNLFIRFVALQSRESHYLIIANPEEVQFSHQVLQLQSEIYCLQVAVIYVLLSHTLNSIYEETASEKCV